MKQMTVTVKDNLTGETNQFEMDSLFLFGKTGETELTHFADNITYEGIAAGIDAFSADHPELLRAQVAGSISRIAAKLKNKIGGNENA